MSLITFNPKLTKNFNINEFMCHDGTHVPWNLVDNCFELCQNLQVIRDYIGVSMHVNSGYRNPTYNENIGGEDNSFHQKCMAADIVCKGYTPKKLADVIENLIYQGKIKNGGLGIYTGFIHYDIGPARRW